MMKGLITAPHKPRLVVHMHTIDLENKKRRNVDNFCGFDDGSLACINSDQKMIFQHSVVNDIILLIHQENVAIYF